MCGANVLTPVQLEFLTRSTYTDAEALTPAFVEAARLLASLGLVEPAYEKEVFKNAWGATPRGQALIEHLRATPLPEQIWVIRDERGAPERRKS